MPGTDSSSGGGAKRGGRVGLGGAVAIPDNVTARHVEQRPGKRRLSDLVVGGQSWERPSGRRWVLLLGRGRMKRARWSVKGQGAESRGFGLHRDPAPVSGLIGRIVRGQLLCEQRVFRALALQLERLEAQQFANKRSQCFRQVPGIASNARACSGDQKLCPPGDQVGSGGSGKFQLGSCTYLLQSGSSVLHHHQSST